MPLIYALLLPLAMLLLGVAQLVGGRTGQILSVIGAVFAGVVVVHVLAGA